MSGQKREDDVKAKKGVDTNKGRKGVPVGIAFDDTGGHDADSENGKPLLKKEDRKKGYGYVDVDVEPNQPQRNQQRKDDGSIESDSSRETSKSEEQKIGRLKSDTAASAATGNTKATAKLSAHQKYLRDRRFSRDGFTARKMTEEQKERKRLTNRLSARRIRERERNQFESLSNKLAHYSKLNDTLQLDNKRLERLQQQLQGIIAVFRTIKDDSQGHAQQPQGRAREESLLVPQRQGFDVHEEAPETIFESARGTRPSDSIAQNMLNRRNEVLTNRPSSLLDETQQVNSNDKLLELASFLSSSDSPSTIESFIRVITDLEKFLSNPRSNQAGEQSHTTNIAEHAGETSLASITAAPTQVYTQQIPSTRDVRSLDTNFTRSHGLESDLSKTAASGTAAPFDDRRGNNHSINYQDSAIFDARIHNLSNQNNTSELWGTMATTNTAHQANSRDQLSHLAYIQDTLGTAKSNTTSQEEYPPSTADNAFRELIESTNQTSLPTEHGRSDATGTSNDIALLTQLEQQLRGPLSHNIENSNARLALSQNETNEFNKIRAFSLSGGTPQVPSAATSRTNMTVPAKAAADHSDKQFSHDASNVNANRTLATNKDSLQQQGGPQVNQDEFIQAVLQLLLQQTSQNKDQAHAAPHSNTGQESQNSEQAYSTGIPSTAEPIDPIILQLLVSHLQHNTSHGHDA